jgi:rubrerythrin
MSVVYTLNRAILLEEKFSECYDQMSQMASEELLSEELKMLAQEELGHAHLLKTGVNIATKEPDLYKEVKISTSEIDRGINLIDNLIDSIKNKKIQIMDAISNIYDLEMVFEQVHMNNVAEFEEPTLKDLFEALSKGDRAHRERLEIVAAKLP